MEKFSLTTAIDYVNGEPHIGHAYEKIFTDIIFRHYKKRAKKAFMLTGTDEHGIKLQKTAKIANVEPKELCDKNANAFKQAWKLLDIDYTKFIRTTDTEHTEKVQDIFEKLLEKGDIYKHKYTGLYCTGCECFLSEKDLDENGCCPVHNKKPEIVSEENYFFKLTKYKDKIEEHIKTHPDFIRPSFRVSEVLNQLESIEDISVSRAKANVSWGIEVKSDPSQVIYVWIDALSNYITALGYDTKGNSGENFKEFWPVDYHIIGKDILKFHSIYWIGILMALGVELPKSIFAHGWIMIDKSKMSKSTGNVISPKSVMEAFKLEKPDALRYFMAASAIGGRDGNYSDEDFKEKVNADLANNLGNLLNRTLNMLIKYFDGEIKEEFVNDKLCLEARTVQKEVLALFDEMEPALAANKIISLSDNANKYVNDSAPWALYKEGKIKECGEVLYTVLNLMIKIAVLIEPYCPNIAFDMACQLKFDLNIRFDEIKDNMLKIGKLIEKSEIHPVFLRLDSEFAGDKKKN
ncbi:MAG: methionine--tRNA ligase [Candidatus Gastranaerophilales bacterium]|nr:methionine--tRNA ligase [Candidatus Gastranaerophilales bacterium]